MVTTSPTAGLRPCYDAQLTDWANYHYKIRYGIEPSYPILGTLPETETEHTNALTFADLLSLTDQRAYSILNCTNDIGCWMHPVLLNQLQ